MDRVVDLTGDRKVIDLTDRKVVDLTDQKVIDLTDRKVVDLTGDQKVIDLTDPSVVDETKDPLSDHTMAIDPPFVDLTKDPLQNSIVVDPIVSPTGIPTGKPTGPIDADKEWILRQFFEHLEGKTLKGVAKHDGQEGHAVERAFGITPNARNEPDIRGYELKKCSNKITFFDLGGVYPFSKNPEPWIKYAGESATALLQELAANAPLKTRTSFIRKFGTFKEKSDGRVRASWSGTCFPKVGVYNACGQTLEVDPEGNIVAFYNAALDQRLSAALDRAVPIALWPRAVLEKALHNKFGQKGFLLCKQDAHGVYRSVCFGPPITFDVFLDQFRKGVVHIDSGMKEGNARNYSHFRAPQHFWLHLVQEEWTSQRFFGPTCL
jgi:hypothetical protein